MSRIDPNLGIMPSLFDRLIDPDSGGTSARRGYNVDQMEAAVRRDLEELLNTRQSHSGLPEEYKELHSSIYAFGLPDLNTLEAITPAQRDAIGLSLATIISRFEPRLRDVRATIVDSDARDRALRFRVDARLCLDPAPEVAFDTVLELTTGHYTVHSAVS